MPLATTLLRITAVLTLALIGSMLPVVRASAQPPAASRPGTARARATLSGARTLVIAHLGGAAEATENTLPTFRRALRLEGSRHRDVCDLSEVLEAFESEPQALGARAALVGNMLTLVQNLLGDASTPLVSDLTYSELLARRSNCAGTDGGSPELLTLDDLLGQVTSGLLDLDIKPCKHLDELITEVIGALRGFHDLDRIIVEPPDLASAQRLRAALGPRLKLQIKLLGLDFAGDSADALARALALKPHSISVPYLMVSRQLIERAHRAGVQVWAWTVDSQSVAHQLARLGVDAIKTNMPSALINWRARNR